MNKIYSAFAFILFGLFLLNCNPSPKTNQVSILLAPFCPAGPRSCTDTLITIEGYLDKANVYTTKFFLGLNKMKSKRLVMPLITPLLRCIIQNLI